MSPDKVKNITKNRHSEAPLREADAFDGLLIVDKPSGPTSHDVVHKIRRRFSIGKVGHGGTLDPMATGVLILLLGRATKQSQYFISSDKNYEGVIRLGISTDSQDAQGKIISEIDPSGITRDDVQSRINGMKGDMMQKPPMVSAVKVDGVPLYKRARKGEEVERKSRLIHIYRFRITDFDLPLVGFDLKCSKGTYVRTLCADIGDSLGCGAHLAQLRRTGAGGFSIDDARPFDEIMDMSKKELAAKVLPLRELSCFRTV